MNMVNTTYNSTKDMIDKLQQLNGKAKERFCKNINIYYNEMKRKNFQTQEDPFAKISQGISKTYHEVLLCMKLLQTKPQGKKVNINYYDLYYTVIESRDDKEIVNDEYEDNEVDYINFNDFITPNQTS